MRSEEEVQDESFAYRPSERVTIAERQAGGGEHPLILDWQTASFKNTDQAFLHF
jgi:hypothetical protein